MKSLEEWKVCLYKDFSLRFASYPVSFRRHFLRKAKKIIASDKSGFKLFLSAAIAESNQGYKQNQELLRGLNLIYLCAWLAYDIYDDYNDGESKSPELPFANLSIYEAWLLANEMDDYIPITKYLGELLRETECANYQEIVKFHSFSNTKIQSYPNRLLYQRASGQLLALFSLADYWKLSPEIFLLWKQLLVKIISLRQMFDDLYDCWSDLENKQINSVNWRLANNSFSNNIFGESSKKYFYMEVLPDIFKKLDDDLKESCNLARKIEKYGFMMSFFFSILSHCEGIIVSSKKKHAKIVSSNYLH